MLLAEHYAVEYPGEILTLFSGCFNNDNNNNNNNNNFSMARPPTLWIEAPSTVQLHVSYGAHVQGGALQLVVLII